MQTKWPIWIVLLIVAISLVYIWLLLFRSSITQQPGQFGTNELEHENPWFGQAAALPDGPAEGEARPNVVNLSGDIFELLFLGFIILKRRFNIGISHYH